MTTEELAEHLTDQDYIEKSREEPKTRNRGWFFPVCLTSLCLSGKITASEMVLLGYLDSLVDEKNGCWATNKHFAKKWNCTIKTISRAITKFERMGLIEVKIRRIKHRGTYRRMWTTYSGRGAGQKCLGGLDKNVPSGVTTYSSIDRVVKSPPAERDGLDKSSFLVNGESPLFKACDKYRQFLVRNPAIRITSYMVKERWMPCTKDFLQRYLHNDQDTFISTLEWYIKNAEKEKYLPDCQNMSQFCRRFASIRKQMMAQLEDAPYHIEVKRTGPIEVVEDDAPAFEEP